MLVIAAVVINELAVKKLILALAVVAGLATAVTGLTTVVSSFAGSSVAVADPCSGSNGNLDER
jgi:hypothetical protein